MLCIINNPREEAKSITRHYYTDTRATKMGRLTTASVDEEVEHVESAFAAGGNAEWCGEMRP